MNILRKFRKAWKAETPLFWKCVAGSSTTVIAIVLALTKISILSLTTPEWFTNNAWNIIGGATALGIIAKTRVKKTKEAGKEVQP